MKPKRMRRQMRKAVRRQETVMFNALCEAPWRVRVSAAWRILWGRKVEARKK